MPGIDYVSAINVHICRSVVPGHVPGMSAVSLETLGQNAHLQKEKKKKKGKTIFFAYEDPISLGQKWVNYQTRSQGDLPFLGRGWGNVVTRIGVAACGHVVSNRHDRTLIDLCQPSKHQ